MDAPGWTEVRVVVPAGWHELVAGALADGPCTSISVEQEGDQEVVQSYLCSTEDTAERRGQLASALAALARTDPELAGLVPTFRALPPEDYAESWKDSWRAFRVGRRLVVAPPWWEGRLRPGELRLELEAGGSFGSGRHPTTRACLRALLARVRGGERVLDAGCGNGVLGVTAALLGADEVLGFDLDPASPAYGAALAAANGVAERCSFRQGDFEVLGPSDTGFDGLAANIYADVLQARALDLAGRLRPGGWFVFSGVAREHGDATSSAITAAGLTTQERHRRGRWLTFIGTRAR